MSEQTTVAVRTSTHGIVRVAARTAATLEAYGNTIATLRARKQRIEMELEQAEAELETTWAGLTADPDQKQHHAKATILNNAAWRAEKAGATRGRS